MGWLGVGFVGHANIRKEVAVPPHAARRHLRLYESVRSPSSSSRRDGVRSGRRHVAALARASIHCAALAKRALELDGPRGAEAALRLAEGRGVDALCASVGQSLMLPAGTAAIGSSAFEGCRSLTTITLPAGLATIGGRAFSVRSCGVAAAPSPPSPPSPRQLRAPG